MKNLFKLIIFTLLFVTSSSALTLQKGTLYTNQDIKGYLMSEKLDGIRAYWDGKNLLTRQNKVINAPEFFTQNLPPFELDGELWTSRGDFENIQSIVMDKTPSKKWSEIKYMIFEVPHAKGDFLKRLEKAREHIEKKRALHVEIIEQKICNSKRDLDLFLKEILSRGGEGVMLKDASREYFEGRSEHLLKVKKADDMEAEVIGIKEGKGKFKGLMGSLHVRVESGVEFFIGSGFSDEDRKNPPKIGEIVTFKYYGFTKEGKPKFASFMRVRED
ncbi:ATP dependent DNA ligase, central [Sulfurimonas denitrificans DSM 1251]|uniref:ATP dependent DNA ligase, central n=1 Tax=Sulfurimonas denitrificans (strain ATCC 33889 / DSM 1251) TaxID=326298 RepID=Q30T18_SULDN|nr:DNA ligase [Sulfurimonas denitrificans]ABB43863.1 ATP dependent DNA ligase, central [Sulfurimonas denitrificans DSM 1251]MDD3442338.1 DNA ligase [Sulfurimonas denitrificans]